MRRIVETILRNRSSKDQEPESEEKRADRRDMKTDKKTDKKADKKLDKKIDEKTCTWEEFSICTLQQFVGW